MKNILLFALLLTTVCTIDLNKEHETSQEHEPVSKRKEGIEIITDPEEIVQHTAYYLCI